MKLKLTTGVTSKLTRIFIQDSSSTTGAGLTGLVYNSSGLTWYWIQEGDSSATSVTLATMTVGTWASGGFKEVDSTNLPGVYEIGIPNAAIDANGTTHMMLKGATNMAPVAIEIECDAVDYLDATSFGLSRLDAAISSRMATYTQPTGFLAATFPTTVASTTNITAGTITTTTNLTNMPTIPANWITAAGIAASALDGKGDWSTHAATDIVSSGAITTSAGAVSSVTTVGTTTTNSDAITVSDILTTQMTESYATDGTAPTMAQALFAIQQFLQETNVSGTTLTVKKLDGSTTAMTFTLDDATSPTNLTRVS